jgi:hypothetical protein
MKFQFLSIVSLLILTQITYAGSIYKCVKDNGRIVFKDKPCGAMKGKLIHQETKAEAKAFALKRKISHINRLVFSGKNQQARNYAKKHQLEKIYKQEVEAYNFHLEQQLKQQQLATKKDDKAIKERQLQLQQQALELQKQQLEQQKQQLEVDKAAATKKKTRYLYPYTNSFYKKYDTDYSGKKNQASHYKNKTKVGNVHLQIENEAQDIKINLHGSF